NGRLVPMGKTAAIRVVKAEQGWMELVKIVKDIVVIKNVVTLMGNEIVNMSLLYIRGVPLTQIFEGKFSAMKATKTYRAQEQRFEELSTLMYVPGILQGQARTQVEQEMLILQDAMQRNPVYELME